jgi:hypothetical protein
MACVALCAAMVAAGCANPEAVTQARLAYADFITQPRTYRAVSFEFVEGGGEIAVRGVRSWTMEAPLNPLHAMPQDREILGKAIDAAKNVALGVAGIAALQDLAKPTIVTQPPAQLIPTQIIEVPAAGGTP